MVGEGRVSKNSYLQIYEVDQILEQMSEDEIQMTGRTILG